MLLEGSDFLLEILFLLDGSFLLLAVLFEVPSVDLLEVLDLLFLKSLNLVALSDIGLLQKPVSEESDRVLRLLLVANRESLGNHWTNVVLHDVLSIIVRWSLRRHL